VCEKPTVYILAKDFEGRGWFGYELPLIDSFGSAPKPISPQIGQHDRTTTDLA